LKKEEIRRPAETKTLRGKLVRRQNSAYSEEGYKTRAPRVNKNKIQRENEKEASRKGRKS